MGSSMTAITRRSVRRDCNKTWSFALRSVFFWIGCDGVSSMRHHSIAFIACLALTVGSLTAQAPKPAPNPWTPPRLADGHPDLQGMYDVATMTPLERPGGIDRLVLTKEEAAAMEKYEY